MALALALQQQVQEGSPRQGRLGSGRQQRCQILEFRNEVNARLAIMGRTKSEQMTHTKASDVEWESSIGETQAFNLFIMNVK